jgi:multiple sugar transport system ATP-binding protein
MSALSISGIAKRFGAAEVLRDVSLEVAAGEFMVLLGPSGCGKSTLLNVIAGLEEPERGRILIGGAEVTAREPRDRDIAMVFQSYALYPTMTVRRNMEFGLRMRGASRPERERLVAGAARLLQIEALLDRKPGQLSGGQRQRVAIGRAIVRQPSIFLFDEPLSNLDAKLRAETRLELKQLHARLGATMIYVTHDQVEAMTLGTRIAVMNRGAIEQVAPPQEIYDRPATLFVAGFTGAPPMNLIPGRIVASGSGRGFRAAGDEGAIALPEGGVADALEADRPVVLGIRPEDIGDPVSIETPHRWEADMTPLAIEPTGADAYVTFALGQAKVVGRFKPSKLPPAGAIRVAFDCARLSLFHAATGRRL